MVESTLAIIESIVQNNMNKDELEEFLTNVRIKVLIFLSKSEPGMITRSKLPFYGKTSRSRLSKLLTNL